MLAKWWKYTSSDEISLNTQNDLFSENVLVIYGRLKSSQFAAVI